MRYACCACPLICIFCISIPSLRLILDGGHRSPLTWCLLHLNGLAMTESCDSAIFRVRLSCIGFRRPQSRIFRAVPVMSYGLRAGSCRIPPGPSTALTVTCVPGSALSITICRPLVRTVILAPGNGIYAAVSVHRYRFVLVERHVAGRGHESTLGYHDDVA